MQTKLVCLGLISLFFLSTQAFPYPNPYANPHAMANPFAQPEPRCCGAGPGCAAGLCSCCGGTCENGACNPIIGYADGFYGPPRIQGGYGNTYNYVGYADGFYGPPRIQGGYGNTYNYGR